MGTVVSASHILPDGTIHPIDDPQRALEIRDGLVELHYDYCQALLPTSIPAFEGMWRWRSFLPLEPGPIRYPLAVGGTPLLASPGLRTLTGLPYLFLKDETRSPTGSNKDRATALVLEHALRAGVDTVTASSTGNVAVSLAVGAAAAGLRAVIFVPACVGEAKLRLMLLAGATVFKVEEGYKEAFQLARQAARAFGWYDRSTGANPLTLEAKKTVALEIWEQLGREVPEAVVVPVGDGTTLSAVAKGFRELMKCGVADRMPRIIGVQAEGCQPLKNAWSGDACPTFGTIADGIAVEAPANALTAVRDVRESGGRFVAVPDGKILEAIGTLACAGGIVAEPAAAAGFAGAQAALVAGYLHEEERVVILITGTGLKTPQYLEPNGQAFHVHADLREVEGALRA